jgi:UDP-GlcNAc:undecaprenyl-phosphate/decaprenyl-phosphate GlcNAc-1-phosphate transferase
MPSTAVALWPGVLTLLLALVATPVVRAIARKTGAIARPKADRWHRKPTALLGGVAIYAAAATGIIAFAPRSNDVWVILGASSILFALGLTDDFRNLRPYQKLIVQVVASAIVVYSGLVLPWFGSDALNAAITIFWLVGITNAVNLLDNMDGLAAGIALISALFLAFSFPAGSPETVLLVVFAAALLGFLVYNFNPASIFMGDSGSLFIGFFLASSALVAARSAATDARSFLPVLAVPVLVLFIPIFDTTLVTLVRKLSGRAVSQGGRDHTSHRLVALGLSERRAVLMLYGFAIVSGALSIVVKQLDIDVGALTVLAYTVFLTLIGVYLARVKVYTEEEIAAGKERPLVAFLVDLSYKRRVFEVVLDVLLVVGAYYTAYLLMFGPMDRSGDWLLFLETLPLVVAIKMAVFLATGLYRGLWRYFDVESLILYVKSATAASVALVVVLLFAERFIGFSRAVFALDGLIMLLLLTLSRMAFLLIRRLLRVFESSEGKRVLIYGAGDAGELLLREMKNNRELGYVPVGFVDDDGRKAGKKIHGLTVHRGDGSLADLCRETGAEHLVVSTTRIPASRLKRIAEECRSADVVAKRMRIQLEPLDAPVGSFAPPATNIVKETDKVIPVMLVATHGSTRVLESATSHADLIRTPIGAASPPVRG